MKYEITRTSYLTQERADSYHAVTRSNVALNRLWAEIYAMLEADGGLDTERGKRLEREFEQVAGKVESEPLKHGYYRDETFYLRDRDTLGPKVTFRQFR